MRQVSRYQEVLLYFWYFLCVIYKKGFFALKINKPASDLVDAITNVVSKKINTFFQHNVSNFVLLFTFIYLWPMTPHLGFRFVWHCKLHSNSNSFHFAPNMLLWHKTKLIIYKSMYKSVLLKEFCCQIMYYLNLLLIIKSKNAHNIHILLWELNNEFSLTFLNLYSKNKLLSLYNYAYHEY